MNTRLIKETRDLLPVFAGTLLLIAVPYLIFHLNDAGVGYAAFGLACAVMGGSSFGNEFQHRTISLLLSQPIPRSVIWREKMLVLGAGILASAITLLVCLAVSGPMSGRVEWLPLALIPLCAFCGAPCWTLLARHGIAGMVFAAVAPGGILAVYALVAERFGGIESAALVSTVLCLAYCVVVYWLGYAKFKRLEDVDARARELSLPAGVEAFFVRPLTRLGARFQSPFAALLKKEFRLQQISFLVAGLFFLFAVAGACLIQRHHDLAEAIIVGDCFICVLIVPLIAGATAVAEEKGWGIAEWHLTLPPSALNQWSAKMLAALSTSLALGLLLPTALFLAANALLDKHGMRSGFAPVPELLGFMLGSLLLTCVAVYAASFSNTTLRAILVAFALIAASLGAATLVGHGMYKTFRIFGLGPTPSGEAAPLALCAGFILLLCLTQWFAWSNFRRSRGPARRLVIQFLAILLAVGLITAAVVVAPYLDRILDPRLIYSH